MSAPTEEDRRPSLGRRLLRVLVLLVVAVAVLYALFFHVFPWVERTISNPSLDAHPPTLVRTV